MYKRFIGGRELKYSLRSACKHLHFDKCVIAGDHPPFSFSGLHIPVSGPPTKHENGFAKLQAALESVEVSDPFILMNDDFFILQPFESIPYFHMGKLVDWIARFPYRSTYYEKAIKTLSMVGDKANIFELHFPFLYEKQKLRRLIEKYSLPCGIMLRTLYAREYGIKGQLSQDFKAKSARQLFEYSEQSFMSTSEQAARTATFTRIMRERFPDRCRFELS